MTAQADTQARVVRYAIRASVFFVLLVSTALFLLDSSSTIPVKISAVAAGLFSSVLFAVLFSWQTAREQKELVRLQIAEQFNNLSEKMFLAIDEISSAHLPLSQYPGTAGFDSRFNKDIQNDIRDSRQFLFRGSSAKYIPARLLASPNSVEAVRVLVDHPASGGIRRRAQDRINNTKYAGKKFDVLLQDLQHEVATSLIGLFDVRQNVRVEIGLMMDNPSVTRLEVFDNASYVSLYRSRDAREFPETLKYRAGSTISDMFRLEALRQLDDVKTIHFSPDVTDADLLLILSSVTGRAWDIAELARARKQNRDFTEAFMKLLQSL